MQANHIFQASRFFAVAGALLSLLLASGCSTPSISNLTAPTLISNPSNIYTITARIKPQANNYIPDSVVPQIIIGGQVYKMNKSAVGQDLYEFDYQVDPGVIELAYYFLVNYQVTTNGSFVAPRTDYSALQRAKIIGRNTLGLTASRGPVGAHVGIFGRGFTRNDNVYFDDTLVSSSLDSVNSLSFQVPALEANRNYTVSVGSAPGQMPVGTFRIDALGDVQSAAPVYAPAPAAGGSSDFTPAPAQYESASAPVATTFGQPAPAAYTPAPVAVTTATQETTVSGTTFGQGAPAPVASIRITPSIIHIRQGERVSVSFISSTVATGGSPDVVDVTTDIPDSVIMPEVYIPIGKNSATVTLQGGSPGKGYLFVKAPGSGKTVTVPVTVER